MHKTAEAKTLDAVAAQIQSTRKAARTLSRLATDGRNQILLAAADLLEARAAEILRANQQDCTTLELELARGNSSAALLKRLKTSSAGIKDMARQVRDVARMDDPLGQTLSSIELDDGLVLNKVSC